MEDGLLLVTTRLSPSCTMSLHQNFAPSIEISLWFTIKLKVRISSNKPYDLGDNLAKNLDGHRSKIWRYIWVIIPICHYAILLIYEMKYANDRMAFLNDKMANQNNIMVQSNCKMV